MRSALQRRAARNLRRHFLRGVRRVGALMLADLAALQLMRLVLRGIRNEALLGGGVAAVLQSKLPPGYLGGWQFAAAMILGLYVTGNYSPGDSRRDPARLFLGCALAVALPLWISLWTDGPGLVLLQFGLTVLLVWSGIVAERLLMDRLVDRFLQPTRRSVPTLFVGEADSCRGAIIHPAIATQRDYLPVGWVDIHDPPARDATAGLANFPSALQRTRAEIAVVCGHLKDEDLHQVAETAILAGVQLVSLPRSIAVAGIEPKVVWRAGHPLVELTAPSLRGWQLVMKRALDLVGAATLLTLATPIMLAVAVAIWIESRGPILFRQVRVGLGGREFRILKFRSMVADAEARRHEIEGDSLYQDPRLFKVRNDPRVTRIGAFLRRTSLDELPQLWNVIRGEMALVGPRPPLPGEVALYEAHHYTRFDMKPGVTGPWQVNGRNEITDFDEVIRLETAYIRNWSPLTDLTILLRTIPIVVRMRGAL